MMQDKREQVIRDLTQKWLDATVRGDADALDPMLEDGYTFTHATTAITDTREEWLESFRSGARRYRSWVVSDQTVRFFGGTAVCHGLGRQEIIRPNDEIFVLNTSFANVWVEQDGAWLLAIWQATMVPDA